MKPITEDVVLSLIKGAERRQSKLPIRARDIRPSARIIDFASQSESMASDPGDRVINLDFFRRAGRVRRTVSGVFCYVPRP